MDTPTESESLETRVESFKDQARDIMLVLAGQGSRLLGAVGDNYWDLAGDGHYDRLSDEGHQVLKLPGGGYGLKLDPDAIQRGWGEAANAKNTDQATVVLRPVVREWLKKMLEGAAAGGTCVVAFDIDDTVLSGDDTVRRVGPVAQVLTDLIWSSDSRQLARRWGIQIPRNTVVATLVPVIITARPFDMAGFAGCIADLKAIDIALSLWIPLLMRPAEPNELESK